MSFKEKLLEYNKRGLIHAPDEPEDHFFLRCRRAALSANTPFSSLAGKIFDIHPDWVWVMYADKGLRFWEGACTWINVEQTTVQLKHIFQKKSSFLGYSREEILAHELVHVVRNAFEEPIFEEILAYQSSSSRFRRFCAPLFRNTKESLFFMLASVAFFGASFFEYLHTAALIGFSFLLAGSFMRLVWAQCTFARAKKNLLSLVDNDKVLAVMVRLTDREIIRFSKMQKKEIAVYVKKMSKIHMRWQQIIGAYFSADLF